MCGSEHGNGACRSERVDRSMLTGASRWERADGSIQMGACGQERADGSVQAEACRRECADRSVGMGTIFSDNLHSKNDFLMRFNFSRWHGRVGRGVIICFVVCNFFFGDRSVWL